VALWRIEFSKEAYKSYKKLEKSYQRKIDRVLSWLMNKEKIDIKPVRGQKNTYRIRVGKYRLLVKIYEKEQTILVVRIGLRGDFYKKI